MHEMPVLTAHQPSAPAPFPFDTPEYAAALAYLGEPAVLPGLPWPVILRPIPNSDRVDALGPWPYASPLSPAQVPGALAALRAAGVVTLTAFLRPDQPLDADGLRAAGLGVLVLKPHFVYDVNEPLPAPSKKTRFNLSAARRRWQVEPLDLAAEWPTLAALHDELAQRRNLSRIARHDARHFERLAAVPGAGGLCVREGGALVAALVVLGDAASVHFHALLGTELAYRERAFYALYAEALRQWGPQRLLCLGGVPSSPDAVGVERFKRRFATSTRPLPMLTAILDAPACVALAARQGAPGYFPPYRTPAG